MNRLTIRQAELWCMKAREEQERSAELVAAHIGDAVIEILCAVGLVKRA